MKNPFQIHLALLLLALVTAGCPHIPRLDTDGDGISDDKDHCPSLLGTTQTDGCPDGDHDGIKDSEDACPTLAGLKSNNGCPINDKDHDGIADSEDDCPDVPGTINLSGCPDSDGDGIQDNNDLCPDEAGPIDLKGCPDSDGDGVADYFDHCPDEKGSAKNKGCPEVGTGELFNTISGSVLSENSQPVPNAKIYLEGIAPWTIADAKWTLADENGNFIIKEVSSGRYRLIVSAPNFDSVAKQVKLYESNPFIIGLTFILETSTTTSTDGSSRAEENLWQQILSSSGEERKYLADIYFSKYKKGKYTYKVEKLLAQINNSSTTHPDTSVQIYDKTEFDCIEEKIGQGIVAFDTLPSKMVKDESYHLEVAINEINKLLTIVEEKEKELNMDIDVASLDLKSGDTVANVVFEEIQIGSLMKVTLTEQKGKNEESYFDIIPSYPDAPEEKEIDCELTARWGWDIKPIRKGEKRKLLLNIYAIKKGTPNPVFRVKEKEITIDVKEEWYQTMSTKIGGGLLLVSLFSFLFFIRKKSRKSSPIYVGSNGKHNPPLESVTMGSAINGFKRKRVFLSYAHEDEDLKVELDKHLSSLRTTHLIETWSDREIIAGQEWDKAIKTELYEADIILFLISADFISSDYIKNIEIPTALTKHQRGEAQVVPIFLRPCDFKGLPFEKLQGFPKDAKPVTTFQNIDVAFTEIAAGIRKIVENNLVVI